ncbi:MAG: MFS transporter, partial [Actinomycetota bacterium]
MNDSTTEQVARSGGGTPGSITAALRHHPFRRVWLGQLMSNTGSWMQNVVLGILAYELTGAAWFVGVLTFAQLGPMLLLSPWGGVLADRFDRRRLLVAIAGTQLVLSLALAVVVVDPTPSKFLITL